MRCALTPKPAGCVAAVGDFFEGVAGGAAQLQEFIANPEAFIDQLIADIEAAVAEDHEFWNVSDQAWQETQLIDAGDLLLTADGATVEAGTLLWDCLLYTSPSPRDATLSRMPSSA